MSTGHLARTAVCLSIVAVGLLLFATEAEERPRAASAPAPSPTVVGLDDLVFLTEDTVFPRNIPAGCDALSIASVTRRPDPGPRDWPLVIGPYNVSPGRIATTSDFNTIVAMSSNGFPFITELHFDGSVYPPLAGLHDAFRAPWLTWIDRVQRTSNSAAIAIMDDGDTLLVTRSRRYVNAWQLEPPYTLDKHSLSARTPDRYLGSADGSVVLSGIAVEILHDLLDPDLVHIVTHNDVLHSVRVSTMQEAAAPVPFATIAKLDDVRRSNIAGLLVGFADLSTEGRYLITNRWYDEQLNVVDLVERRSWTVNLPDYDANRMGGIAINKAAVNRGLLAVHGENALVVYAFDPQRSDTQHLTRVEIPRLTQYGMDLRRPISYGEGGPFVDLAWSGTGEHIIIGGDFTGAEFGVFRVSDSGRNVVLEKRIEVCGDPRAMPNDIVTVNKRLAPPTSTPTPSSTASATPVATQTPPPLPTRSATPSATAPATATPTPSATRAPAPTYLPLALVERCDPARQRIDVALVLDASTSMAEPARDGRAKRDAAIDAARIFLGLLDLATAEGDQAAVVAFNATAVVLAPLTADRAALDAALDGIALAQQTRLDLAVAEGARVLSDATTRRAANQPVLVLLTDGRANPVPVEDAVGEANRAKDAGVSIFTIGLGDDLDFDALAAMASRPDAFLRAPDAEDLAAAFRTIARRIPCPAEAFWGGR